MTRNERAMSSEHTKAATRVAAPAHRPLGLPNTRERSVRSRSHPRHERRFGERPLCAYLERSG